MPNGPLSAYRAMVQGGALRADPMQELAVEKLQILHNRLANYRPAMRDEGLFARFKRNREPAPEGLYIFGDVGRGKSMLMDLFFDLAPIEPKRRVHFHAFMLDVHATIHRWRGMSEAERAAHGFKGDDPIPPLARKIADEALLLCFDEFQVSDVADAMILGRLFEALLDAGVVPVLTSNRAPGELYKDGLNRDLFLPTIDMLTHRLDVLCLASPTDYRLERLKGVAVYHTPLDEVAAGRLDATFHRLTDAAHGEEQTLEVQGRTLVVREAARGVARFCFAELCEQPLGAADYLAIAREYTTVILSDIPRMGPENRNEAKRFVTLIDTLYDHRVKLVCSAAAPPEALYPDGDGSFEFARTVSRLVEMQAQDYLGAAIV
jgi:cell division protein ZapE